MIDRMSALIKSFGTGTPAQRNEMYSFIALFGLILLSRLVFLSPDLGNDPDAYRFSLNAEKILSDHRYYMSRSPGNPLYELLNAPLLVFGGGLLTNLLSMLVSMAGLVAFYLILKYYSVRRSMLLLSIFALVPVVWISSIITMDYWWSLTLLLWAYYFSLTGRYFWGGVFIGLATGCRLTSGFLILPILLIVWKDTRDLRKLIGTSLVFSVSAILCWLPVFLSYGIDNFSYVPYAHPFVVGAYRAVRQILGIPALAILSFAVMISWSHIRRERSGRKQKEFLEMMPIYLWIVVTVGLFVRVPADPAYLLPSLPFLFIAFDSLIAAFWWIPIGALIILNNLVSFIAIDSDAYKRTRSLRIKLAAPGVLLKDRMDARQSRVTIAELQSLKLDMPDDERKPLILTGALTPQLQYYLRHQILDRKIVGISPHDTELIQVDDRWFGRSVSEEVFKAITADGFAIYYTPEARYSTKTTFKYDLHDRGAIAVF